MSYRHSKTGYFVLEGLNSFSTTYFFNYFYFFMAKAFGFDNRQNLTLAAINGLVYAVCAWGSGKFAQRFGYFTALKLGFGLMAAAMGAGLAIHSAVGQAAVLSLGMIGVCFTWPALEALVSEDEPSAGLQRMVGLYNVVWAGTAALAFFIGGTLLQSLGLASLFYLPMAMQLGQLALTFWLERQASPHGPAAHLRTTEAASTRPRLSPARARSFQRMAWLANPSAYVAINTLVAVIPGVAQRLSLSTAAAGFFCSLWLFSRLAAFAVLWRWAGWHYRFRWLLAGYLALVASFAAILTLSNLALLIAAQVVFGCAVGLCYYSSLFYSMDLSEAKGEHGGLHEAAIGLGNFTGPALGASFLYLLPHSPNSGTWAVSSLLMLGLGGMTLVWRLGWKDSR
jgi:MFS family permease